MGEFLERIKTNEKVIHFVQKSDAYLKSIGYTEHGERHSSIVSKRASRLLAALGYDEKTCEVAAVAGYMHDFANMVGRVNHGQTAAFLALNVLEELDVSLDDITLIMTAVGNHEEEIGDPTDPISSALVIADKSDVHRSRVRNQNFTSFDIHDRVNYAVTRSVVEVDNARKIIKMVLSIDTSISKVMEYFEIFLSRMLISRKAATVLSCEFQLIINDVVL